VRSVRRVTRSPLGCGLPGRAPQHGSSSAGRHCLPCFCPGDAGARSAWRSLLRGVAASLPASGISVLDRLQCDGTGNGSPRSGTRYRPTRSGR
jgi:hypothetical protein